MHLASFLGKFPADIISIPGQVLAQFLELLAKLPLMRRHNSDRGRRLLRRGSCRRRDRGIASSGWCRSVITFSRTRKTRRHDRLVDFARTANRTSHETALDLLVVGHRTRKPALECVPAFRSEERRVGKECR